MFSSAARVSVMVQATSMQAIIDQRQSAIVFPSQSPICLQSWPSGPQRSLDLRLQTLLDKLPRVRLNHLLPGVIVPYITEMEVLLEVEGMGRLGYRKS
jgi:hypothetical protein